MSRELFLARRLIEAAANPYVSPLESEDAANELATLAIRFGSQIGYPVRIRSFEGMRADDLSPMAWLLLLENAGADDPDIPIEILERVFQETEDEVVRFRLISATLGHPRVRLAFERSLDVNSAPIEVMDLPDCWPKQRILGIERSSRSAETADILASGDALQELVLYLLQDGSQPALALAAAAIAPENEPWRQSAHDLASKVVRALDPDFNNYGRPFRKARI